MAKRHTHRMTVRLIDFDICFAVLIVMVPSPAIVPRLRLHCHSFHGQFVVSATINVASVNSLFPALK
ncbi:hypothetical protein BgiBS90_017034, partial [Biomphalaria glabrata]